MRDLRVDLILLTQQNHRCRRAGTAESQRGKEYDVCACGQEFEGDGALTNAVRHRAEAILAALDEAAMVP